MADMNTTMASMAEVLGKKICGALEAKGYKSAIWAPTADDAARAALGMIADGASVGVPGTVTVRQLGLIDRLREKGCAVHQHWEPGLDAAAGAKRRLDELLADWYVTSSNAMTYDGMMVNIDGGGNRVAGMAWATGKLLWIVSVNKACPDIESAIKRARDVATPANALRLGDETPCTKAGHCVDCNAPNRYCRVLTIIERAPFGRECHAIIVGEPLGY